MDLLTLFSDIIERSWNFISTLFSFILTILKSVVVLFTYIYVFNPVVAGIMILALFLGVLFGVLKLIKLLPLV